jgi:hypothetical protein
LIVIPPPIVVIGALILTAAAERVVVSPLFGEPAFSTTISRPSAEVPEIAALIVILPLAFKVRVESAEVVIFVITPVASTVIFPS